MKKQSLPEGQKTVNIMINQDLGVEALLFTDLNNQSRGLAVVDEQVLRLMLESLNRTSFTELKATVIDKLVGIHNREEFYAEIENTITVKENIDAMDKYFNRMVTEPYRKFTDED